MFSRLNNLSRRTRSFVELLLSVRTLIDVRVRFAPSPTGFMHIGGLRTALINRIFADQQKGTFILRIEDTDKTRINPDSLMDILRCLEWANLMPSEGPHIGGNHGPYIQSERQQLYSAVADQLVASGYAYPCFCTPQRLALMRNEQSRRGEPQRYDNRCRNLSSAEVEVRLDRGEPYAIRFKMESTATTVEDIVFGRVTFGHEDAEGDFIIMKSDKMPVYHLANVVDDHFMRISHVIRGAEWLSSLHKHMQLYAALGWRPPLFAHLPLILSNSGGKLSKRSLEFSRIGLTRNLIAAGYLPSAVLTWLASVGTGAGRRDSQLHQRIEGESKTRDSPLSGWSPTLQYNDLVDSFNVNNISRQNVHLSVDLLRICGRTHFDHIVAEAHQQCVETASELNQIAAPDQSYQSPALLANLRKFTEKYHPCVQLPPGSPEADRSLTERLYALQGRVSSFSDLFDADTGLLPLWQQPVPEQVIACLQHQCQEVLGLSRDTVQLVLTRLLESVPVEGNLEKLLHSLSLESGIRKPVMLKLLRICLTGNVVGLPALELVNLLTLGETVRRLERLSGELSRHWSTAESPSVPSSNSSTA